MTGFPYLHHAYLDYTEKARREGGRDAKETAIAVAAAVVATVALPPIALVGALLSLPVNVGWAVGKHIWLKVCDPKALELTEEQKKWNLEHGRGIGPRTLGSAAFVGLLDGAVNAVGCFLAAIPFSPLFILHDYLRSVPLRSVPCKSSNANMQSEVGLGLSTEDIERFLSEGVVKSPRSMGEIMHRMLNRLPPYERIHFGNTE